MRGIKGGGKIDEMLPGCRKIFFLTQGKYKRRDLKVCVAFWWQPLQEGVFGRLVRVDSC